MDKLKPILAVMRKNLLSMICGLVALAAIIALFWPISGYYQTLQTEADARKSTFTTLNGLLKKERTLPLLDPQVTEPQPLKQFPTETVINRGRLVTKAVHEQSEEMMKTAMGLITHKPLVPDALPTGTPATAANFRI